MTRLCLDTSGHIHFGRDEPRAVEVMDRAQWIGVPSVVVGELWAGFLGGGQVERNVRELGEFLDHAVVEVLCVDEEVAREYGEIVVDLRRRGHPLPTNDIWVAATAARAGAAVLTFDEHFRQIDCIGTCIL